MEFIQHLDFDFISFLQFYIPPFKYELNPSKIWNDLDDLRNKPQEFIKYFRKYKTYIKFIKPSNPIDLNYVTGVAGLDGNRCEIFIHATSRQFKKHKFTTYWWRKFKLRFLQTLLHEMIHLYQFDHNGDYDAPIAKYKKTGDRKIDDELSYFSDHFELQSYAHCCWLEIKRKCYRTKKPFQTILKQSIKNKRISPTMHQVFEAFSYNQKENNAPKFLIKNIIRWENKYEKMFAKNCSV